MLAGFHTGKTHESPTYEAYLEAKEGYEWRLERGQVGGFARVEELES